MIEVKVTRKVMSFTLGVGGIGNVDWTILLECGHKLIKSTTVLSASQFQSEYECTDCEKMATHDLEYFHVVDSIHDKKQTVKV